MKEFNLVTREIFAFRVCSRAEIRSNYRRVARMCVSEDTETWSHRH